MEMIRLNNNLECPVVGIGTFMLSPAEAETSVREALKMGYRLVDTANAYVNERAVGRGMTGSSVSREEIFLSTKLWPSEYENENAVDETFGQIRRFKFGQIEILIKEKPVSIGSRHEMAVDFFLLVLVIDELFLCVLHCLIHFNLLFFSAAGV